VKKGEKNLNQIVALTCCCSGEVRQIARNFSKNQDGWVRIYTANTSGAFLDVAKPAGTVESVCSTGDGVIDEVVLRAQAENLPVLAKIGLADLGANANPVECLML
jgi:hypothetical protein